jgi:hypothetical protein
VAFPLTACDSEVATTEIHERSLYRWGEIQTSSQMLRGVRHEGPRLRQKFHLYLFLCFDEFDGGGHTILGGLLEMTKLVLA